MTIDRRLFPRIASMLWLPALLLVAAGITTANGIPAQETGLNPSGTAYELNRDEQGDLWISDYGADQIWQVTPATGVYTIYQDMANATDARRDAAGMVWWTDTNSGNLGRISPSAGTVTTWTLPAESPRAIAFDGAGQVWITDFYQVHRFRPGTGEVCTYPVPDDGYSVSIAAQAGNIWLGDGQQNRILNLDPASNLFTLWQLAAGAFPRGLTHDGSGDLWWADENLGALARLEPGLDRLTAYTLPDGTSPKMIAPSSGKVWYTSSVSGTVGVLDPTKANGTSSTLITTTMPVTPTPTCNDLGLGISSTLTLSAGILAWTPDVYTRTVDSGGWSVYQLPSGAYPWGLAAAGKDIWVVDPGRQKLAWLSDLVHIYLPVVMR
jgi:streptogramin lyase